VNVDSNTFVYILWIETLLRTLFRACSNMKCENIPKEGSSQVVKQSIFWICCSITWLSQGMFRVISSCHFIVIKILIPSYKIHRTTHTIIPSLSIFIVWYIYLHERLIVYGKCLDDGDFLVNNTSPMDAMGSSTVSLFNHG